MSLHDIDKSSDNRILPEPNQNDQTNQYLAQGTTQNQNSQDEAQADGLKFLERQIIAKQDGFNKAIFGFYGDANKFGLKVAEDGIDVLTATDDQLLFNSEQNVFKIVKDDTAIIPAKTSSLSDTTSVVTYVHNLGFVPAVVAFIENPSFLGGRGPVPGATNVSALTDGTSFFMGIHEYITYGVTSTSITFTKLIYNPSFPSSFVTNATPVKFYLLQETAN